MSSALRIAPRRFHLTRLMSIWRSAGWPCRDAVELDLVAAGWAALVGGAEGHQTIRLTDAGVRLLAESRQRNQRSLSVHDQLAARVAAHLMSTGRIVWRELSLRARITPLEPALGEGTVMIDEAMWLDDETIHQPSPTPKACWRMARPDVFSVRRTSVEDYLLPMVHEVKVSRADLLSDLRNRAKRESYQWLSCETYYVLPAGVAEPQDIPETFGVWLLHGTVDSGTLDLVRPARHAPCKLPFSAWLALAKAVPVSQGDESTQQQLGDTSRDGEAVVHAAIDAELQTLHSATDK